MHSILDPLAPLGLEWVASGYSGLVDTIKFQGGREGFAIDNLTYEVTTTVPEPGSFVLLLSGIGAVGICTRRRKRP